MASSEEDDVLDTVADGDEDLFGGDDDDTPAEKNRELSDRDLDSGDDEDRNDRAPQEEEVDYEGGRDARVLESTIWRHPLPKPIDGEVSACQTYLRMQLMRGSSILYGFLSSWALNLAPTNQKHSEYLKLIITPKLNLPVSLPVRFLHLQCAFARTLQPANLRATPISTDGMMEARRFR